MDSTNSSNHSTNFGQFVFSQGINASKIYHLLSENKQLPDFQEWCQAHPTLVKESPLLGKIIKQIDEQSSAIGLSSHSIDAILPVSPTAKPLLGERVHEIKPIAQEQGSTSYTSRFSQLCAIVRDTAWQVGIAFQSIAPEDLEQGVDAQPVKTVEVPKSKPQEMATPREAFEAKLIKQHFSIENFRLDEIIREAPLLKEYLALKLITPKQLVDFMPDYLSRDIKALGMTFGMALVENGSPEEVAAFIRKVSAVSNMISEEAMQQTVYTAMFSAYQKWPGNRELLESIGEVLTSNKLFLLMVQEMVPPEIFMDLYQSIASHELDDDLVDIASQYGDAWVEENKTKIKAVLLSEELTGRSRLYDLYYSLNQALRTGFDERVASRIEAFKGLMATCGIELDQKLIAFDKVYRQPPFRLYLEDAETRKEKELVYFEKLLKEGASFLNSNPHIRKHAFFILSQHLPKEQDDPSKFKQLAALMYQLNLAGRVTSTEYNAFADARLEPSKILALIVSKCDDLLALKPPGDADTEAIRNARRFFEIQSRLPIELQQVMVNRLSDLTKDGITSAEFEHAMRLLVRDLNEH